MYQLDNSPGRSALMEGKEFLFFSGYSYLGLSHIPTFKRLVIEGIEKYGLLHPSSRISNTTLAIYDDFEKKLSCLTGLEETVSFSSGYLAGRAITEVFAANESFILPSTHAVMQNGQQPVASVEELVEKINKQPGACVWIYADSVNPLKAQVNDFTFLKLVNLTVTVNMVIDDSHGIGLIGEDGKGIVSFLPYYTNVNYILSYSLSKAFHINGGAVSCNKEVAGKLRKSPYYTASTPLAPAMVYAFNNGDAIYKEQQKKLQNNIAAFIELIKDIPGISYHPLLPVFILKEEWDDALFGKQSIIISSFSYPDPLGKKINRIVLNALHRLEDLQKVAAILHELS